MNQEEIFAYLKNEKVMGARVCLFNRDEEVLLDLVYNDEKADYKVKDVTRFGIASMTKFFTALAIMKCQEQGLLNINDPVSKYLEDFEDSSILIKHFMSHSSGFFPQKRMIIPDMAKELGIDLSETELAYDKDFLSLAEECVIRKLNHDSERCGLPGENFSYFNDGYALLSQIVARVSPYDSFGEFLDQEIFKVLHMDRSSIAFLSVNQDPDTSDQFYDEKGSLKKIKDYYDNAFILHGGGAIKSTMADLLKLGVMFLRRDETLVSASSLEEMMIAQASTGPDRSYGLGLQISKVAGRRFAGHDGSLTGVSSSMLFDIEAGLGVIVLSNTSGSRVGELARQILCDALGIDKEFHYEEEDWDVEDIYGEYRALEGYGCKVDEALWLDDLAYPYLRLKDKTLLCFKKGQPVFITVVKSEGKTIGLRYGMRIIPKAD